MTHVPSSPRLTERSVPYACPYCTEEALRPELGENGEPIWHCLSCLRLFGVTFFGVHQPAPYPRAVVLPGLDLGIIAGHGTDPEDGSDPGDADEWPVAGSGQAPTHVGRPRLPEHGVEYRHRHARGVPVTEVAS